MNLNRRLVRSVLAAVLTCTSVVTFASAASALGGEQGVLLLKGPGSLYGQPGNVATLSVAAGTAASFAFEVRNTGTSTAQYNLQLDTGGGQCAAACTSSAVVTSGSVDVTSLIAGPNGYFTAPIAPGAVATYTLKITVAKTGSTPGDDLPYQVRLSDTAGNQLGRTSQALVNVTRSTGTGGADQFVSSSGTPATSGNAVSGYGAATAPTVAVDKTFSYTVKLMNDSATATFISYHLLTDPNCSSYFPVTIAQKSSLGSTNVTTAVLNGTYRTATLAHGGSVTLIVTGTSLAGGAHCLDSNNTGFEDWLGVTGDSSSDSAQNYLVFSPVG